MWPIKLHDEAVRQAAEQTLPGLVEALSEPIKPATQDQLRAVFATNPHQRRMPWQFRADDDGKYTFSTAAYEGTEDAQGRTLIYDGINYQFDHNGRLIKREYVEGERSYNSHRPRFQEFLTYDDQGYLTQRLTWGYIEPTITDRFDYTVDEKGHKTPAKMTRTMKVSGSLGREDSAPLAVDLANYEEWLATNPNGFSKVSRERLNPKELEIADFSVSEYRKGILFAHPEQLEHALVMYGDGTYPTPGGETALEHNESAFAASSGVMGSALLSLYARSGNMREFVSSRITNEVQDKWKRVQKSRNNDTSERAHFSFDYDGAGHFQKSNGNISITKNGLELTLSAAYVGDQVEDQLASALQTKRGLRSAEIAVPINQTERDGYFFIDVQAACERLGIPVAEGAVEGYLRAYTFEDEEVPKSSYDRKYGEQPVLWEDAATGVTIDLVTERRDYDSDTDLDDYYGHDSMALWGPLPKEVRLASKDKATPKLRILVKPTGDPFSEETAQRTDEIVRSYMSRLEASTA